MSDLCKVFSRYFDVITSDRPWVMDEAFKLRYQVYCVEQEYEDASQFEDRKECDDFDCRSAHGILSHKSSGLTAATVRLVLPDKLNPEALFPIEKHCKEFCNPASKLLEGVQRQSIAEISRFAVSKDFKRRLGEAHLVAGIGSDQEKYLKPDQFGKRMIPHLILGLFIAVLRISLKKNVTHWYAVMDISLLRLLSRFGIDFIPIGEMVNYHGLRQPCIGSLDDALNGIWLKRPDIWQLITRDGTECPVPTDTALTVNCK